jgi:molecular chaperone HtpG
MTQGRRQAMNETATAGGAVERFAMTANFDGLVQILAKNLYPEPDVFIRELIQNGHDGIRRRQSLEPDHAGHIAVEIDAAARTITFRDNGLGMDRQDIHEFLSVIGSTGTGSARQQLEASDPTGAQALIGHFGIGTLSAFVVADSVRVRTRKSGSADGWSWENRGTVECTLEPADLDAPGTSITVHLSPRFHSMLAADWVRSAVIRYCDFIAIPITIDGQGPVNAMHAPWHESSWTDPGAREVACRAYLARHQPDHAIEIIPIDIDSPVRARGLLYISDGRVPSVNAAGVVDVYVRRMFVRGNEAEILPVWARFVRGVIESPDLTPTAARDNVQRDDACKTLTRELGDLIIARLQHLAINEPARFEQLARWHHYHFTTMAACNDELFDAMRDLLLFETNRGLLPLRDCVRRSASMHSDAPSHVLHYVAAGEDARPFYPLADAAGIVVASPGHAFEEQLLDRYARGQADGLRLVRLDASADSVLFRPPSRELANRCRAVETEIAAVLHRTARTKVRVAIRRFEPHWLSSVVVVSADAAASARMASLLDQGWLADSLEEITREALDRRPAVPPLLVLNEFHPLLRRVLDERTGREGIGDVYCGLFLSACLRSRNALTDEMADALQPCLDRLVAGALDQRAPDQRPSADSSQTPLRQSPHVH